MLTVDSITRSEGFSSVSRARPPRVLLPVDRGEEELARDFSLSEIDKREIRRCRGDDHRRRFALQLCAVRKTGRFLDSYRQVSTKILIHLSRQLELSPVLFVSDTERSATEYDYTIADEDLARISPLMHQHVIPNGTYHFARSKPGDNIE